MEHHAESQPDACPTEFDQPVEPAACPSLKPSASAERLQVIDSLRGFAILGILSVNMIFFAWPLMMLFMGYQIPTTPVDVAAEWLVRFFAEGKFYTMFSFLFGLGMAVQMERCEKTGRRFVPFFAKRMAILALFGACHAIFVWPGDILFNYACLGFVLILFRNRSVKALFRWALFLYICFPLLVLGGLSATQAMLKDPELRQQAFQDGAERESTKNEMFVTTLKTYQDGTWLEMTALRAQEFGFMVSTWIFSMWSILVSFLMGMWGWRRGLFKNPEQHHDFFHKVLFRAGLVGISGSFIYTLYRGAGLSFDMSPEMAIGIIAHHFGQFGLCYAYMAGFILLHQSGKFAHVFNALANVGRMALSNYLSHSIFITFIFYNHGFGLLGTISHGVALLMTLTVFVIQIFFSRWWLSRFRFGPMEWLWRSLTYAKAQPMRRS